MNYLQDKRAPRGRFKKYSFFVYPAILLMVFFAFRTGFLANFSGIARTIARPAISVGHFFSHSFSGVKNIITSKNSLAKENAELAAKLEEANAKLADREILASENENLKAVLGRKTSKSFLLSVVLAGPGSSAYDTFLIDAGKNDGVFVGQKVFADGVIVLGTVEEVYNNSARVRLFSSSGVETSIVVKNGALDSFVKLTGRGGGNFEMDAPKDFVLEPGTAVALPGLNAEVVAIAGATISDPRDPKTKILFTTPINIFNLKFVELLK